jgi:glyoxylase-like metal-dependent hydrolase (beta-lactamase superfamily II)
MEVLSYFGSGIASNTFLLIHDNQAVIIDASCYDHLVNDCERLGIEVKAILLTHGHFDHTLCLDKLRDRFKVPVYIHENDADMLYDGYRSAYNVFFGSLHYDERRRADCLIDCDKDIKIGNLNIEVISTPGHTSGSVCYLISDTAFTGDTLFASSVGRCDLPSGDHVVFEQSLRKVMTLPQSTKIYSGHGPCCDIQYVSRYNQYVLDII